MQLIALKPMYDSRWRAMRQVGELFDEPIERNARSLIKRGVACDANASFYKVKVVQPEVKPLMAEPFRHLPVLDDGDPPAMAAVRNSVMAAADVPAQRVPDRRKRRATKRAG